MPGVVVAKYGSAAQRWSGIGPYYAMFPASFAQGVIRRYTNPGDVVFDPFAGRGTAVFAAAINQRVGIGIEINPVGYVYTRTKLYPAKRKLVESRIQELADNAWRYKDAADELPNFFHHCYSAKVRRFLLTARKWLDWRSDRVDCTVMGLLLVHLHGKRSDSLSNQMRQTKSLSPPYAVEWWKTRGMKPPQIEPFLFMQKKLNWRYAKGRPKVYDSRVFLGNSESRMGYVQRSLRSIGAQSIKLLLTSPPYCGVTNYHYDQWIRLWLLGGPDSPAAPTGPHQGKFVDQEKYRSLIKNVFCLASNLIADDGVVYVRTDSRRVTQDATIAALKVAFPKKKMYCRAKPFLTPTQTQLFGSESHSDGEVDIILR